MYRLPDFELHAGSRRLEAGAEILHFLLHVEEKDEEKYLDFVTANYEDALTEGHMIRYGNTDRLNPIGYTPNFQLVGPNGFYIDQEDRNIRVPIWQFSPRKSLFCVHFDILSIFQNIFATLLLYSDEYVCKYQLGFDQFIC